MPPKCSDHHQRNYHDMRGITVYPCFSWAFCTTLNFPMLPERYSLWTPPVSKLFWGGILVSCFVFYFLFFSADILNCQYSYWWTWISYKIDGLFSYKKMKKKMEKSQVLQTLWLYWRIIYYTANRSNVLCMWLHHTFQKGRCRGTSVLLKQSRVHHVTQPTNQISISTQ